MQNLESLPTHWLGAIALAVAIFSVAFASIFLAVAERELTPFAAIFHRLTGAAIALGLWQGGVRLFHRVRNQEAIAISPSTAGMKLMVGLFLLAGSAFTGSLVLLGWALTKTSVANATLLYNNIPVFTAAIAWLFLGQRFSLKFVTGMAIALVGVVAIGWEDLQVADIDVMGDVGALIAAAMAAVSLLCLEALRTRYSAVAVTFWMSAIGSGLLLPLLLWRGDTILPASTTVWGAVIGMALISHALGQGLMAYCVGLFSAGLVAVCMLLIPVTAAVLAAVLFGEQLSLNNYLAFGVVLVGVYLAVSAKSEATITEVQPGIDFRQEEVQ